MPRRILPALETLASQLGGIVGYYRRMLDDEFAFAAQTQVPQVAVIFDLVDNKKLTFSGDDLTLNELLTLIAYRYGFETVQVMGNGGYAIVVGHKETPEKQTRRRVLRFVPEHHVRNIVAHADPAQDERVHEFDVRLEDGEPVRDPDYPLLLSDLFLMPRHTTKLVFYEPNGGGEPVVAQAAGYPASLHCQLLPEVRAFNSPELNRKMAIEAGNLLEAALATVGVSVADAHGGNGGALVGADGQPLVVTSREGKPHYIPVVLDYGYYSRIGARTLAAVLIRYGVTYEQVEAMLAQRAPDFEPHYFEPWTACLAKLIDRADNEAGLPRSAFGRLLFHSRPDFLDPFIWIDEAEHHWQTIKEKTYPPLQSQSRLTTIYPDYDEVLFPQRIEEYRFML